MADSPLRECWQEIGRAEEHLRAVTPEIRAFLDSKPFATDEGYDSKQSKYLSKLKVLKPIPQDRWALMIGDCVHNARSALDYLAWRLAGSKLNDRTTLFPICDEQSRFDKVVERRKLKHRIHPDALLEITRSQPYIGAYPKMEPLWLLDELNARDKHKLLSMTYGFSWGAGLRIQSEAPGKSRLFRESSLEDGAVLAEVAFPAGTLQSEVKVEATIMFDVAFEEGISALAGRRGVEEHLRRIISAVKDVVARFDQLLLINPNWIPS